jgi:hypothetical protein
MARARSVLLLALTAACGPTASMSELGDAVPRAPELSLALRTAAPAGRASCPASGPSTYGAMTHEVAATADGVLADVLGLVDQLTAQPATAEEPGQATWGPIVGATSQYVLAVHQTDATGFEFFLGGEALVGGDAWQGVIGGTSVVRDDAHRSGEVDVDFTTMRALDPDGGDPLGGGVAVQYEIGDAGRHVTAHFGGIVGSEDPEPSDSQVELVESPDHTTGFAFSRQVDVDGDDEAELVHVESQWVPDGRGTAHVVVTGGSLGSGEVRATECWDPAMGVVYAEDGSGASVGSAGCCPF